MYRTCPGPPSRSVAKRGSILQPVLMLPTTQQPLYTNIQHPTLVGGCPTPTSSPFPQGVSVLGETKGKRKNQAGKCCRHEGLEKFSERLHPSPLHPVPSRGNLGEERHTEMEASYKTN